MAKVFPGHLTQKNKKIHLYAILNHKLDFYQYKNAISLLPRKFTDLLSRVVDICIS